MRTAKTLIRLGGCPGWSVSSLGAHVCLLILSWGGSYIWMIKTLNVFDLGVPNYSTKYMFPVILYWSLKENMIKHCPRNKFVQKLFQWNQFILQFLIPYLTPSNGPNQTLICKGRSIRIPTFRTDKSGQTVQTHSVYTFWTHYSMIKSHCSNLG